MKSDFSPPTKSNCWFLENDEVAIAVAKRTGFIQALRFKKKNLDLFQLRRQNIPGYAGYIRIYDEREGKWYNDLAGRFRVTKAAKRGNRITLTKKFQGAPFVLTIVLELEGGFLTWRVQAQKANASVADRSLRVGFNFPLQAGWKVWAPCKDGDFTFDGMDDFNFNHVQITFVSPREIILPMVSHYDKDLDVGYSMLEPIDAKVPAARFQFENGEKGFNWGYARKQPQAFHTLETLNYYIGLVGKRPMSTEVMLTFHEGDWRCGLGRIYKRWREYFDPDSQAIYDCEGVFHCGGIEVGEDPKPYTDLGLKTLEVHGHFEAYSDYYQDGKDRWLRVGLMERLHRKWQEAVPPGATGLTKNADNSPRANADYVQKWIAEHTDEEIAEELLGDGEDRRPPDLDKAMYHTRDNIKKQLTNIRKAGICPFWYFNYTDGFRPWAERRWPDAICRDQDGKPIPSGWRMCHNMNADMSTSFGKFCEASVKKILAEYPQLCGFFLDCFRHYEVEFAHDDGVTVVDNRAAYSVNLSYDEITRRMKRHMRTTGRAMSIFANKPQTIRCMRHVDGVLLEGVGDQAEEKYFWACIAKPNFFMWTSNEATVDENLRRAVLHGCFPKAARGDDHAAMVRLYRKYLPLYELFRRRVLCFEPDPLRVPKGSRGKLYTVPDGYVAGIVNLSTEAGDVIRYARTPYALFRVRRGWDIGKVTVMYPGGKSPRPVKFKFNGTVIAVPIEGYNTCAVLKLFITRKTGKRIGRERFVGAIDFCGDPESSFQDISKR